jgi:hypothetical protein
MNCYEILKKKYNLRGYSPDTIISLMEAKLTEDGCEAYFWYVERVYG